MRQGLPLLDDIILVEMLFFVLVSCGDPGIPENAVRNGDSFLYQDVVVFTCNHGYYQSSGAEDGRRVCQDTGLWSETQPICSSKISQYNDTT